MLQSLPLLVPFSCTFGYFDGAYVTLIPVVTAEIVGTASLSSALGVVYFLHAVPYLVSPPISGKFLERTPKHLSLFCWCKNSELTHRKWRLEVSWGSVKEKGMYQNIMISPISLFYNLPTKWGTLASLERQCPELESWFYSMLMMRAMEWSSHSDLYIRLGTFRGQGGGSSGF